MPPTRNLIKFFIGFYFLYEVASSTNTAIRLYISPTNFDIKPQAFKGWLPWNEGRPLNLTCGVQVAEGKNKIYQNLDDNSDPQYEINWYMPDQQLKEKYLFQGGINQHTLIIQDTRLTYSGDYKCTANLRDSSNDRYPPSLVKEVTVRVVPNSEGRVRSCGNAMFQCYNNVHHCIPRRHTCDGVPDCLDGSDESIDECGITDPCAAKLRCEDRRCMDPSLCCDPNLDPTCTILQDCCLALIESGRQFYKLGVERRNNQDLKFLHSTIYTVSGCVVAFLILLLLVTLAVCRLQVKRGWSWRYTFGGSSQGGPHVSNTRGAGRAHPPITLHDLDVYFASLRRVDSRHSLVGHGITYNINNGVQIVGGPPLPPPYSATVNNDPRQVLNDPPPPYNAAVGHPPAGQQDQDADARLPLLMMNNNEEDNNNGDINGNSDMVDHNLVHHQQQNLDQNNPHHHQIHPVVNIDIHPVPAAAREVALIRGAGPVSPVLQHRASSVRASPVHWPSRQAMPISESLSAVHQAALSPSRLIIYPGDNSSSSDSE